MNWYWSCSVFDFQLSYHFAIWNIEYVFPWDRYAHGQRLLAGHKYYSYLGQNPRVYRGVRHMRLYGYVRLCNSRKNMWKVQESSWKQHESGSKLRVVGPKNVSKVTGIQLRDPPIPEAQGQQQWRKSSLHEMYEQNGKIPIRKTKETWDFWIGRPDIFNTFWYIFTFTKKNRPRLFSNQPGGPTTR